MNTIYYKLNNHNDLWIKEEINLKSNIIDKQKLKVKTKINNNFKIKNFLLDENKLYLEGKNNNIWGHINLNFIGTFYSNEEIKITFFNNHKCFTIFFFNKIIFKFWKNIILKKCILNNIFERFEVVKLINKFKDFNLYCFEKIKDKKKFLVEIISKAKLNQENRVLNFINKINLLRNKNNILELKYLYENHNYFYLVMDYSSNNIEKIINLNLQNFLNNFKNQRKMINFIKSNHHYFLYISKDLKFKYNWKIFLILIIIQKFSMKNIFSFKSKKSRRTLKTN